VQRDYSHIRGVREVLLDPSILRHFARTKDLLKLNRDQLLCVVGPFTGHCHLKGHLFKLRLTDNPTYYRFLGEDESATHILCDCEAVAYFRFRHLGQFFMEPSDYYDAPIHKAYFSFEV
jgi:hypothetical protein